MTLDRANLQGNILRGYPVRPRGLPLRDPANGRRRAQAARRARRSGDHRAGVGRPAALDARRGDHGRRARALDLDEATLEFPAEFRCGMAARAKDLSDIGPSAPKHWDDGLGTRAAHLLLTIHAQAPEERGDQVAGWKERVGPTTAWRWPVTSTSPTSCASAREHFGFADGFSQPAIEGANASRRARA